MRFRLFAPLAILIAAGCSQSKIEAPTDLLNMKDTTSFNVMSKDTEALVWNTGDEISLFTSAQTSSNRKFTVSAKDGNVATFSGEGVKGSRICAVYPYDEASSLSIDGNIMTVTTAVPAIQDVTNVKDVYISATESDDLVFYPCCATARVILKADGKAEQIKAITLSGLNSADLSGSVRIMASPNSEPVIVPTESSAGGTVTLNGDWDIAGDPVYIDLKVLPRSLENGYTIEVTKADGIKSIKEYTEPVIFKANNVTTLSDFVFEGPKFYFEYTSASKLSIEGYKNEYDETTGIGKIYLNTSEIPAGILKANTEITGLNVPAEITGIGDGAFDNCTALASLTFDEGSSLTNIGTQAFRKTALKRVDFPASLEILDVQCFNNTSSLVTVTFPEDSKLTTLSQGVFNGATALKNVVLPASVTYIGKCFNTKFTTKLTITIKAVNPPTLEAATGIFNVKFLQAIKVPASSVDAYKAAWKTYASYIQAM